MTPGDESTRSAASPAAKARILLAEDRPARSEEIARLLAPHAEVVVAPDQAALEAALAAGRPGLLVLAERFAGVAGLALCGAIKARPGLDDLPVLLVLDAAKSSALAGARETSADEFIAWPIEPRDLASRVKRLLGLESLLRRLSPHIKTTVRVVESARPKVVHRILLVEDDPEQRDLLRKRLAALGHQVRVAGNGVEALAEIGRERPEIVVSDAMMPAMNGFELCRRLRADEATATLPVVFATSMDDDECRRRGFEAGADDYIQKPVNVDELLVRIRTLTRIRALSEPPAPEAAPPAGTDSSIEKTIREMNPLELWFHWQARMAATPELRALRRRITEEIGIFLEKRHDYKIGLFFNLEAAGGDVKRAYSELRQATEKRIREVIREEGTETRGLMTAHEEEMLLKAEIYDRFAFGPIQPLLDHAEITDILVGRFNDIHIERRGRLQRTPIRFDSEGHLRRIMDAILRYSGRDINEMKPYVEARLRDGSRISATIPPLSIDGATLTVRKFVVKRMELRDLLRTGTLSVEMASFLDLLVRAGCNVIVSGSTGAGKTTLLNLLGSCIPLSERIITVEDTAELRLRHRDVIPELMKRRNQEDLVPAVNMERFEARESQIDGVSVTIRDIIRLALRKRPDRIVVGEVRGGEAMDMLNAMNTGHRGCLTTIHANNTADMMVRLENMVLEASANLPLNSVQRMVVAAINIAVQVVKFADNTRRITEITEIEGFDTERNTIRLRPLFVYDPGAAGNFIPVNPPSDRLRGIIEEYMMKTGVFRQNWHALSSETEARICLKNLFRRALEAFIEPRLFQGNSHERKRANAAGILDGLAEEIYRWDSVVEVKPAAATIGTEPIRIPLADLADHAFLNRLRHAALWKTAQRLRLPDEEWRAIVKEDAPEQGIWEAVFPLEAPRDRAASGVAVHPGEGLSAEDIQQAFFNTVGELKSRLNRIEESGGRFEARQTRFESLAAYIPYLQLAIENAAITTEEEEARAPAETQTGRKFLVEPAAWQKRGEAG
jgi:pilus assembly protein CpaF